MTTSTPWQYVDATERVVFYTDESGAMHSALVSSPDVQAWIAAGNTPAAPPALSLAQQAQALLAGGCQVASTGTAALSGIYPADPATQQNITAEITSILMNGTFTDSGSTVQWLDVSGATHVFTVAQFKTLAAALAAFVTGCLKAANGLAATLPAQPATIP